MVNVLTGLNGAMFKPSSWIFSHVASFEPVS